jgi:hypothetical protein
MIFKHTSDRGNKAYISPRRCQYQASLEKGQLSSRRCLLKITGQTVFLIESIEIEIPGPLLSTGHLSSAEIKKWWSQKPYCPLYAIMAWTEEIVPTCLFDKLI